MEPEAGRWPEIFFLNTRGVEKPVFGGWNHLQFDPAENLIALYSDKVRPLITNLGFSFYIFNPG